MNWQGRVATPNAHTTASHTQAGHRADLPPAHWRTARIDGTLGLSGGRPRRRRRGTRIFHLPSVLIVCSEAQERRILGKLLVRHGIESAAVATGHAALASARWHRPAVVLVAGALNDQSGHELCRQLRVEHGERLLSIILISAQPTAVRERVAGFLAGADDYVVEPYDAAELIARVRRCRSRSRAAQMGARDSGSGLTRR